jgi:ubiquinone/menaquinone biosynthesis C-methylase UbiE
VPDIDEALAEIRRVLKPEGVLVAATNAEDTMPEFDTLSRRACTLLGHPRQEFPPIHRLFALENGTTRLSHFFKAVVRHDLPSALHFREVQPVLDFVNSLRPLQSAICPKMSPGMTSWA